MHGQASVSIGSTLQAGSVSHVSKSCSDCSQDLEDENKTNAIIGVLAVLIAWSITFTLVCSVLCLGFSPIGIVPGKIHLRFPSTLCIVDSVLYLFINTLSWFRYPCRGFPVVDVWRLHPGGWNFRYVDMHGYGGHLGACGLCCRFDCCYFSGGFGLDSFLNHLRVSLLGSCQHKQSGPGRLMEDTVTRTYKSFSICVDHKVVRC